MQYNMDEERRLTPLPAKNIDTGMGLERIAALKQDVTSVFHTDVFRPLVELGEEIAASASATTRGSTSPCACWPTTPEPCACSSPTACCPATRAAATCCAGSSAGPPGSAATPTCSRRSWVGSPNASSRCSADAYPELHERRETHPARRARRGGALQPHPRPGLGPAGGRGRRALESGSTLFPGAAAFVLHDTYGFPVEVTREIVAERGLSLDVDSSTAAMERAATARPRRPEGRDDRRARPSCTLRARRRARRPSS